MVSEKRDHPEECFENSWYPDFSILRHLRDEKTLVETRKEVDADGDDLSNFFIDSGDTASPCEVEVLEVFCRGVSLKDVESGTGRAGHQRVVWLDDRNYPDLEGSGDARQHENPLTATGLCRALKRPRFHDEDLPDAARRLLYITDLDPACIHALAATASSHQAPVLRNAIYKHLTFQTSIAVKCPSAGFLIYQLDLHLPFFLLRKSTPPEEPVGKVNTRPRRQWTDLSFLKLDTSECQDQESKEFWGIHEAQISCVVTGSDDWRWVGYGFVDTEIDGFLTDLSEVDLSFDRIAAGGIEAKVPIWRPRDYWLKVFEVRIEQVRREWEYLIYKVELGVNQYMNEHPCTLSRRSGTARERAAEMKEAFDWALQTMGLLRRLNGVLSDTVEAWKSFNSPNEDIGYFYDTDEAAISPNARRSLHTIKAVFRQLRGNRNKLVLLKEKCSELSRALEIRMRLESKETADHNVVTSEFTVSILYPVGIAAAIFSMQQEVIPFDLNPRSFALVVFLLIAIVYVIRFVIRHVRLPLSLMRRSITLGIKRAKLGESGGEPSENESETDFLPMTDIASDRTMGDEERNVLKSIGTRALLGPSVT